MLNPDENSCLEVDPRDQDMPRTPLVGRLYNKSSSRVIGVTRPTPTPGPPPLLLVP